MVLEGKRAYSQMYADSYKLMRWRPQRSLTTDLVHYYGTPGTGKTTTVSRVLLNTVRKLYPKIDYYSKMVGLSKFFDGYDNKPLCWIDDPVVLEQEMMSLYRGSRQ